MSRAESNYVAWLEEAESDLLNIENNLAASRIPWDTVCFHAQQAGEKLLKGFLVYHGIHPPRMHDLEALLTLCARLDASPGALTEVCSRLTDFAVVARYPRDLADCTESEARVLVSSAYRVRDAIRVRLPGAG